MVHMIKREGPRNRPLSVWNEKDSLDGEEINVLVIILDTPGCSWSRQGGCSMCGYNFNTDPGPTSTEEYISQMKDALDRYRKEPYIKIFTSGSFLDPGEIQKDAQEIILGMIREKCGEVRVLLESRPEFVTEELLGALSNIIPDLEIAIGLETADDKMRSGKIRKGFTFDDYLRAGKAIISKGLSLKTYLLLKPPITGEKEAMEDTIMSIVTISREFPGSRVSVNPMNIQKGTDVERLFSRGIYKPPWLWTLLETLLNGLEESENKLHLMSSPTAGGKKRGSHNCGACDDAVLRGIERFSIDNDPVHLDLKCHCRDQRWRKTLEAGDLSPTGADLNDLRDM